VILWKPVFYAEAFFTELALEGKMNFLAAK
jgi:hypothetical protein